MGGETLALALSVGSDNALTEHKEPGTCSISMLITTGCNCTVSKAVLEASESDPSNVANTVGIIALVSITCCIDMSTLSVDGESPATSGSTSISNSL